MSLLVYLQRRHSGSVVYNQDGGGIRNPTSLKRVIGQEVAVARQSSECRECGCDESACYLVEGKITSRGFNHLGFCALARMLLSP